MHLQAQQYDVLIAHYDAYTEKGLKSRPCQIYGDPPQYIVKGRTSK